MNPNPLTNKDLLTEFYNCMEAGHITEDFAHLLYTLVQRVARSPNFNLHPYIQEMETNAMHHLVERKTWRHFKPEKSDNIFGFYVTIIRNAFAEVTHQKKQERLQACGKPTRDMKRRYERAMQAVA